jgi:hypothetical protein
MQWDFVARQVLALAPRPQLVPLQVLERQPLKPQE